VTAGCDVRLVTCRALPAPDEETPRVQRALAARGLDVEVAAWDDPRSNWPGARLCVLRSTWNYPSDPEGFLAWCERTDRGAPLWNPPSVVRWNHHKGYLLELAARGVPVVPTELVRRGTPLDLDALLARRGWNSAVAKPAVSLGARGAERVRPGDPASRRHVADLLAQGDVLVQRFAEAIAHAGETSTVLVDGAVTHAVCKRPAPGEFRAQQTRGGTLHPAEAGGTETSVARRAAAAAAAAVGCAPRELLYARADTVPLDGAPHVMELELIEPALFLEDAPEALHAFADAIETRLRSWSWPSRRAPAGGR